VELRDNNPHNKACWCSHNEACWGNEGVLWTYSCPSCGRVGRGLTLKLAKEAFAVKRESDKPLSEQECRRPGRGH
jgi:hypothetical protein